MFYFVALARTSIIKPKTSNMYKISKFYIAINYVNTAVSYFSFQESL